MNRKDLTAKKQRWSSDNIIIIRKKPKPKPTPAKVIAKPKPLKKSGNPKKPNSFHDRVLNDMNALLPDKPYAIGINKEIFEKLKANYEGDRTKLRKAIKHFLRYKTQGKKYLKALLLKEHRNGLDGKKYPILKRHREFAKTIIIEKQRINNESKKRNQRNDSGNRKR